MAKIIDEVWKPADFNLDSSFKKVKIDAKANVNINTGTGEMRSWSAEDLNTGVKSGGSWNADDFSVGVGSIKVKQTPEQFVDDYISRQQKEMNQYIARSPESEYHSLAADRLAVQNGGNDMFSGYHRTMAKRFRQSSQDTFLQKVADILGIDVFRLERAFNLARVESGGAGGVETDDSPTWREEDPSKPPEFRRTLPKNAFGIIDINIIFLRDWLESKGMSWFGNRFALFFILFTIAIVGGIMILMMSGVLGDLLEAIKYGSD